MKDNKTFKAFRSELNESEYKETLTGYPNRGIDTDVGPVNKDLLPKVNAVLTAMSRYTYQHTSEALIKIRTRLNLFMLDFPWTPWMWQSNTLGSFAIPVTMYGRVDGVDALTGGIDFKGTANPTAGLQQFNLSVSVETAEDGLYRVIAKLQPREEAVLPEGVEEDGDAVTEDYQTDARAREMANKIEKHEQKAQSGYAAKMTQSGKAAARGRRQEAKHDAASRRLMKRDQKEQDSPRTYGRGGKLIKRGSRAEVKEEAEQIDELLTPMRDAITARERDKATADYNNPNLSAAQQKKAAARASRATYARLRARSNDGTVAGKAQTPKFKRENEKWRKVEKSVKEGVEAIEEMHKVGDTVKVPHKGKMVKGKIVRHDKGGSGKAAQHGGGYVVDVGEYSSITVPHHKIVKEEWKSLKKTKADLNAIRASGKKVSVQHGEGDTLYRVSKAKKSVKEETKKPWWEGKTRAELDAAAASASAARKGEEAEKRKRHAAHNKGKRFFNGTKWVKEEAEQIDELSKKTLDSYISKRGSQLQRMTSGLDKDRNLLTGKQQANAVKGIKQAMSMKAGMKEELIGGQKRLDVNKNKKLDAQDFAMLRAKKKPMKEYTEMMPSIPLQIPNPTEARADKSGKGKRFHKGAIKSVEEAVAKGKKKPSPRQGAANVIGRQKAIKSRLEKHDMRW